MRALGLLVSCGDYIYDPQTGWVTGDKLLLTTRDCLDLLGTVPVFGLVPDVLSAGISFGAGEWKRGLASVGSIAIPGLAAAASKGAKCIANSLKVADKVEHAIVATEKAEFAACKIEHVASESEKIGIAGERNYVYRGLASGENPANGLAARAPEADITPLSHVAGARQSNWISTTSNEAIAQSKYGANSVVRIDLSRVQSEVVDLSNGIPNGGRFSNYAKHDSEVLIRGYIPSDAISTSW